MRNDRHLAIKLRKQKKSYNAISKRLNIPKSTLHYWFKGNAWSKEIKKELQKKAWKLGKKQLKLMAEANKKKWDEWHKKCQQEAVKEFPSLKNNRLFLAGLMLYWGEGDSKIENGLVRLSNTDSAMVRLFVNFLYNSCRVSRKEIKAKLILYPDLKEENSKKYWSRTTRIPLYQFRKTQFIYGRHPTRRLKHGVCDVYVCSRKLKEKIFVWIKLYQEELCGSSLAG